MPPALQSGFLVVSRSSALPAQVPGPCCHHSPMALSLLCRHSNCDKVGGQRWLGAPGPGLLTRGSTRLSWSISHEISSGWGLRASASD